MGGTGSPVTITNGVPVITAPAEIDLATAGQLRLVLMHAAGCGHTTIVVDMTRTRFCDSTGLHVLVRAHQWALTDGGELRLAIPADGAAFRIFAITSLDRVIPRFDSLAEALLPRPAAVILPFKPRRSPGLPRPPRQASSPGAGA
jgi:anti-sigma B factor antagonist